MDFFVDTTSNIDSEIQNTYYPGLVSEADGIDLRIEMNRILYGSINKRPLGHWVVARVFSGSEKSKYWNEYSKEGVGGANHPFVDYLVRARRIPNRLSRSTLTGEKVAELSQHRIMYYLEWDVPLKDGDQIFELYLDDHTTKPDINNLKFEYKEDIDRVHPFRLENGNVQYIAAVCRNNNITY